MTLPTRALLIFHVSVAEVYSNVAAAPSTVSPAPLAAAELAAPLASVRLRSFTATTVELIVVVVPSTCRLPAMTTVPVSSPCAAGSIVNVVGPRRYPYVLMLPTLSTSLASRYIDFSAGYVMNTSLVPDEKLTA